MRASHARADARASGPAPRLLTSGRLRRESSRAFVLPADSHACPFLQKAAAAATAADPVSSDGGQSLLLAKTTTVITRSRKDDPPPRGGTKSPQRCRPRPPPNLPWPSVAPRPILSLILPAWFAAPTSQPLLSVAAMSWLSVLVNCSAAAYMNCSPPAAFPGPSSPVLER